MLGAASYLPKGFDDSGESRLLTYVRNKAVSIHLLNTYCVPGLLCVSPWRASMEAGWRLKMDK